MSELWPLRVAVCVDGSEGGALDRAAAGLLRRFAASRLQIQRGQSPAGVRDAQVVVAASRTPLTAGDRAALTAHLARGGGLVLLGRTLDVWGDHAALSEAAAAGAAWGPETELRVRPVPGSPFAARLDAEVAVTAQARLHPPPPGAEPLLLVPWGGAGSAPSRGSTPSPRSRPRDWSCAASATARPHAARQPRRSTCRSARAWTVC